MADLNARIKPKKSSTTGEVPQAADLEVAEIAVNTADGKLFVKHTDDSIKEISGGTDITTESINALSDVDTTTSAPTNGQVLEWDGTNWVPADVAGGATTIDELSDVDTSTTAPTDGQVLTWVDANSKWEPADSTGGGGSLPTVSGWTIDSDGNPATSQVLNAPTHSAGDLLVACIMSRDSGGTLTPPSGFTLHGAYLSSISFSGTVQTISVFTKTATGSEPSTYTWTQAASSRICGFIVALGGNAVISTVTQNYGNGTTATITTVENRLNLTAATWIYAATGSETYSQSGAGITEITDSPNDNARISGGYTTQAGTVTSTHTAADAINSPNHGMINIQLEVGTSINDSSDVDTVTTPPTDGQVLTWVDANSKWEPADLQAVAIRAALGIGEYADDAAAGTGGVASGAMYYNTTSSDYRLKT